MTSRKTFRDRLSVIRSALLCAAMLRHCTFKYSALRSSRAPRISHDGSVSLARNTIVGERGFSLIEVVIVVALLAVIAGFGMSFSMSSIARSNAQGERDLLVTLLTEARARSLANVDERTHGVRIEAGTDEYVVYSRSGVASGACTGATITEEKRIPMITDATFTGPTDYCFGQLSLRVSTPGTTTIAFAGEAYTVSVNSAGRIDW